MAGKLHTAVGERRHRHDDYPVAMAATPAVEPHWVQDGPVTVSHRRPMASDRRFVCQSDRSMGAVYYTLTDAESQRFMNEVPFSLDTDAGEDGHENQTQNERVDR